MQLLLKCNTLEELCMQQTRERPFATPPPTPTPTPRAPACTHLRSPLTTVTPPPSP